MIARQVTIAGGDPSKAGIIGDNAFIGAGARIIGPVTIGNNVTIGANTVITMDVSDGKTVAGAAQRIVK